MHRKKFVGNLLKWFARYARDLPWRRTRDPYAIWVSEVMLQQTQVPTVIPYWDRWMRALPTVRALARAKPEKIHKLWEGLGYYTRVRNLQRAAQAVVHDHAGTVPSKLEALLKLSGIGRYTAGAICSIAFNQPTPVLDGNVLRVLARSFGIEGDAGNSAVRERFWEMSQRLVEHAAASRHKSGCSCFNQALMELGAVVCTPRHPQCDVCPVAGMCVARQQHRVAELPTRASRPRATKRRFLAFIIEDKDRLLVRQRPNGVVNGHLWEFPNVEIGPAQASVTVAARRAMGVPVNVVGALGTVKHSITRFRITLEAYCARPVSRLPAEAGVWLHRRKLEKLTFPSAHRKLIEMLNERDRRADFKTSVRNNAD